MFFKTLHSRVLMAYFRRPVQHCGFAPFPDPVRKGPVGGGRREADSEVDHRLGARHPVFVLAHKQGQQCRGPAAPRYRHDCSGHPKNEAHRVRKNHRGWHGDGAAPHRADHGQSQVAMTPQAIFSNRSIICYKTVAFRRKWVLRQFDPTSASHLSLYYEGLFLFSFSAGTEAGFDDAL